MEVIELPQVADRRALRAGDAVFDKVSGETWVLAFYDRDRDEAAPCGWPECYVQNASERLFLRRAATDEQYIDTLVKWTEVRQLGGEHAYDLRARMGATQLRALALYELGRAAAELLRWTTGR